MTSAEILADVNKIFIEVLDNSEIVLTPQTRAKDILEWDSLAHIQLVVAIEKYFRVRFTATQLQNWKGVGEMCDCILEKLNK